MALHEDRRVCTECGLVGVTRRTCRRCPCNYCKDPGHDISQCPKAPRCYRCGSQGHKARYCPERISKQPLPAKAVGNVRFQPQSHDDESWFAIPEAIREVRCTKLDAICISQPWQCMPLGGERYHGWPTPWIRDPRLLGEHFEEGGPYDVAREIKSYILPEIQDLQGKTVTRKILDKIWKKQVSQGLWSTAALDMGYVDYITDDRDNEYFRMYHGQAGDAYQRIIRDHGQAIMGGRNDTLHYFLLWLGNGHRTANFLKVWNLPQGYRQSRGEEWAEVLMILYESISIKVFRLHHGLLNLGSAIDSSLGLGLNVMTPLVQGRRMPQNLKGEAKALLLGSTDPQIAYWPKVREAQLASKQIRHNIQRSASRPLFRVDFSDALQTAVGNDQIFQPLRQSLAAELEVDGPNGLASDIPFTGNLSAKIGFLLDFMRISPVSESSQVESSGNVLPWAIQGCNFTKENVLLWTFNFKTPSYLDTQGSMATNETHDRELLAKHLALINASQTRIVLVCGARAEDMLCQALRPSRQKDLELRGFKYPLYLVDAHGSVPKRLLIRCPEIPSDRWSMTATHASRFCEALRFATRMTGTEGIRPYFIESSGVLGHILGIAKNEREGSTVRVTTETLNPALKLWLVRKGFEGEEDIRKLETMAGSLSAGLLILLHALPRGSGNPNRRAATELPGSKGGIKRKRSDCQTFGEVYEPTFAFVSEILNKREAKYHEMEKALTDPAEPVAKDDAVAVEVAEELCSEPRLDSLITRDTLRQCADYLDYDTFKLSQEITRALFEQSDAPPPPKKITSTIRGQRWWHNFRDTEYQGALQLKGNYAGPSPLACQLYFSKTVAMGCDTFFYKIELLPPGSSHGDDKRYATLAKLDDPARRLAFRCRLPKYGFYYPRVGTLAAVSRANTAVNMLEDMPRDEINQLERRWATESRDGKQVKWYTRID